MLAVHALLDTVLKQISATKILHTLYPSYRSASIAHHAIHWSSLQTICIYKSAMYSSFFLPMLSVPFAEATAPVLELFTVQM